MSDAGVEAALIEALMILNDHLGSVLDEHIPQEAHGDLRRAMDSCAAIIVAHTEAALLADRLARCQGEG